MAVKNEVERSQVEESQVKESMVEESQAEEFKVEEFQVKELSAWCIYSPAALSDWRPTCCMRRTQKGGSICGNHSVFSPSSYSNSAFVAGGVGVLGAKKCRTS